MVHGDVYVRIGQQLLLLFYGGFYWTTIVQVLYVLKYSILSNPAITINYAQTVCCVLSLPCVMQQLCMYILYLCT